MSRGNQERLKAVVMLITVLFGLMVVLVALAQIRSIPKPEPELIPSLMDIQKMLNEFEPENPIEEDGKYGPATAEKWERVYIEQSVDQSNHYYE